ncbi:MAG: hypothetical protein EOO02_18155 [Chitinophagaceae bacterium]|nr:MAG: hypothetical protein EOO02_18155 [Chitinophagaceae bacterium]
MKKLLSLLAVSVLVITSSFASTNPSNEENGIAATTTVVANKETTASFTKHFKTAENVSWSKSADFSTASFKINGEYLSAHFSPDSKMLGVSRNITRNELPMTLGRELNDYMKKYWITSMFEYATHGEDNYYVTLENADKKIILKSEGGNFTEYKQTKKD